MAMHAPLRVQDVNLADVERFVQGQAHEVWRLLRAEAPVHWNAGTEKFPGFWSVTHYADVLAVSRDTTTYSSRRGISMMVDPDDRGQPNKGTQSFIAYPKVQFINRLWMKQLR